jgi:hypothetical protein
MQQQCHQHRATHTAAPRGPRGPCRSHHRLPPPACAPPLATDPAQLPGELQVSPTAAPSSLTAVWEVDFCSRPLLDERGKKVWELLVTDPTGTALRYAEYFPNNRINSGELRAALLRLAAALPGGQVPGAIRFFRAPMQTIISRAAAELGPSVRVLPSRRCFALQAWLQQRVAGLYPALPNFDPQAAPLVALDPGPPQPLPDALRGERWAFVSLPLEGVLQEAARVSSAAAFGSVFDPAVAGVTPDTLGVGVLIPGVVVLSRRADALAGWTNGLEIASLQPDTRAGQLLLETGVAQRWAYASWRKSAAANAEAEAWQAAKGRAQGLHFLCVTTDEDADAAGFWLCRDFNSQGM